MYTHQREWKNSQHSLRMPGQQKSHNWGYYLALYWLIRGKAGSALKQAEICPAGDCYGDSYRVIENQNPITHCFNWRPGTNKIVGNDFGRVFYTRVASRGSGMSRAVELISSIRIKSLANSGILVL